MKYILILSLLALTACSGQDVKETLGLSTKAPDEFRVVSRPPLSVPPEFELRPPLAGEADIRGNAPAADTQAHAAVTGKSVNNIATSQVETAVKPVVASEPRSTSDEKFLSNLGVEKVDPSIRDKLYSDKIETKKKEEAWYDNLNFLSRDPKEDLVDPEAEAERLKEKNVKVVAPVLKPQDSK